MSMLTLFNLFRRLIGIQSFALTTALSSGDGVESGQFNRTREDDHHEQSRHPPQINPIHHHCPFYQVSVPPSLLHDVANKKLERDKKPPLGFVPPQNIIADPPQLQTYSLNPNPMKPPMNKCSSSRRRCKRGRHSSC